MKTWLSQHAAALADTLRRMARSAAANLASITILGIAISMPLMLYKLSEGLDAVVAGWQADREITVFLAADSAAGSEAEALDKAYQLLQIPAVVDVQLIPRDHVLEDFRASSGLGGLLDDMGDNPLPDVAVVYPDPGIDDQALLALAGQIEAREEVDGIVFDFQWRERLRAIMAAIDRGVILLAILMGAGVLLVISNMVRLGILARAEEIEIIDQIGGTAGFIRRPFLYYGVILSACGALAGLVIADVVLVVLGQSVNRLAALYGSELRVGALAWLPSLVSVGVVAILGWIASRLTVGGYLRRLRASALGK